MQQPPQDVVELWYRYEEIAMHFNNLIMQYRLQLMAGLGAIGTVASYLIGSKVPDVAERNWLRVLVSGGLLVLVGAAAALDVFYYERLLRGAVKALLDYEMRHPAIQMSTIIEQTVGSGKYTAPAVYAAMIGLQAAFTAWAWRQHVKTRVKVYSREPAQTPS